MGNKSTKETDFGAGHPQRFYDGCVQVQKGCYTVAELYFNQAMARHPGHAFWTSLMDVAIAKAGKPSGTAADTSAQRPPSAEGLPSVLKTETELGTTVFRDGDGAKAGESAVPDSKDAESPHPDANLSLNDPPSPLSGSKSVPTLLFPVDHRLVDLQDYVRMLTDIGRIYRRKAADSTGESQEMSCRLSMLYNAYTAVRLQALLAVLRAHFATYIKGEDSCGGDLFQLYTKRAMNAQWVSSAFRTERDHSESTADTGEVNINSHKRDAKGDEDAHSHDEDVCIFLEFAVFFFFINVVSYALSALRLLSSVDYALSPATQKAVLEMSSRCLEVVEGMLLTSATANAHMYIGALMKKFLTLLGECSQECRAKEETVAAFGPQRKGRGKQVLRSVKDIEVTFLRLDPTNLADQQLTFLRIAMRFPVMTLPLLDVAKVLPVQVEMQYSSSHHRAVKLMTPLERSFGWYMTFSYNNHFEHNTGKPGNSVFLLQKCGVSPGATMKDPRFFSCVGLEELSITLYPLAAARAVVLHALGKTERTVELRNAMNQLALDTYGCPVPLSEAMSRLFDHLDEDATC